MSRQAAKAKSRAVKRIVKAHYARIKASEPRPNKLRKWGDIGCAVEGLHFIATGVFLALAFIGHFVHKA